MLVHFVHCSSFILHLFAAMGNQASINTALACTAKSELVSLLNDEGISWLMASPPSRSVLQADYIHRCRRRILSSLRRKRRESADAYYRRIVSQRWGNEMRIRKCFRRRSSNNASRQRHAVMLLDRVMEEIQSERRFYLLQRFREHT